MSLTSRSMFPIAALGVILSAFPSSTLTCQPSLNEAGHGRAVESFLTGLRVSADGGRADAAGIGVRLWWDATRLVEIAPAIAQRAEVGVYGTYIPTQNVSGAGAFSAYRLGTVGAMRLFKTPLAGMFDPFFSVGAGLWYSRASGTITNRSQLLKPSATALELAPGVGLRVPLGPAAGVHLDVHNAMTVRSGRPHNVVVGAGLRFLF